MRSEISTSEPGVMFTDDADAKFRVYPVSGQAATVAIDTDPHGGGDVPYIRAHELAEVVAALYEAAGQPVPDLPVIHDPAEVKALTGVLRLVLSQTDRSIDLPIRLVEGMARDLLGHGVRLPEAAP